MITKELIKNCLYTNRPLRFFLKSTRNIFFPKKYNPEISKTISIEISSICNARCIFCNYRFGYRTPKLMPITEFTKIVESCVQMGYENLDLTSMGGEFFTNRDAVDFVEAGKNAGFKHIGLFTNGLLIHRFNIDKLLQSGVDVLLISFPGFSKELYRQIFNIDSFDDFKQSVELLLKSHHRLNSNVIIIFEPRTYLTKKQIEKSEYYNKAILPYLSDHIIMKEPLRVYDTWGGDINQSDLINGMKLDINPVKSIYPFKKVFLCCRIVMPGILANGDVRLCNCRYDATIESDKDSLYVGNLNNYKNFEDLIRKNEAKVYEILSDFINGKMPALCRQCPFFDPIDAHFLFPSPLICNKVDKGLLGGNFLGDSS